MQFDLFGALRIEDIVLSELDRVRLLSDGSPAFVELDAQRGVVLQPGEVPPKLARTARAICTDLVQRSGAGFRYVVRSGLHKEVRRGDADAAVRWARLLRLIDGEPAVRQYARRILFEESRAVSLLSTWRTGDSAERRIRQLACAAKVWTLSARQEQRCGARRILAYPAALSAPPLTADQIDRTIARADLDGMYRLLWRVHLAAEPAVKTALRESLVRHLPADSPLHSLPGAASDPWLLEAMIEAVAGVFEEGSPAPESAPVDDRVLTIPALHPYIYDSHTRPGRVRLLRCLADIKPGEPMPSGVDLRWSGMARGVLWRDQAFAAHGTVDVPWEDVPIREELWQAAHLLDGFYYERLYRDAGIHLPFPRSGWRGG